MRISDLGGSMPDQAVDNERIVNMELVHHRPDDDGLARLELRVSYRQPETIDGEVIDEPTGTPVESVFLAPTLAANFGNACICSAWRDGEPHYHVGAMREADV